MGRKTLNQLLADNLARELKARGLSAKRLGQTAKISPRTIANYLATESLPTSTGKERSAKLTEIEKIATALGLNPIALLSDPEGVAQLADEAADAVSKVMRGLHLVPAGPSDDDASLGGRDSEVAASRKKQDERHKNR